ncbi:unnamed protein product [Effrenium voratum]|nr:unnamed protein product [Effrenium voratum]
MPGALSSADLDGIAQYIAEHARHVVVLCGAGISTSAGIPDFRSPGTGLYHNLQRFDLPEAEAIFDLSFFQERPDAFYELCREMWPGNFHPTPCHYFIRLLSDKGILQRLFGNSNLPQWSFLQVKHFAWSPDDKFATGLVYAARICKELDGALAPFRRLRPAEVPRLLKLFTAEKRADLVLPLLQALEDDLGEESYTLGVSSCTRSLLWQQALAILPKAKSLQSYHALISACGKDRGWRLAVALFQEMPQAELVPDAVSLTCAIIACGKSLEWQRALDLLDAGFASPDKICLSAAMSICERGSAWQAGLGLFDRLAPGDRDLVATSGALGACEKGNKWQHALHLFQGDCARALGTW